MNKIRITKISGDKLIKFISTHGNRMGKYTQGYPYPPNGPYPSTPTVGYPFGVYNEGVDSFKTSPVIEILSENTFKTENSIYKWETLYE